MSADVQAELLERKTAISNQLLGQPGINGVGFSVADAVIQLYVDVGVSLSGELLIQAATLAAPYDVVLISLERPNRAR